MKLSISKANSGSIVLAGLIDSAIPICVFVFYFIYLSEESLHVITGIADPNLWVLMGFIIYRSVSILLFDQTLGMRLFSLQYLNSNEELLSISEKLLASIFILFRGVDYYKVNRS